MIMERVFLDEVEKAIMLYESVNGLTAKRTRQMVARHGEIEALSRLMMSAELQKGFQVLRDANELDKTFESIVVKYKELFNPDVVEAAIWRLKNPYNLF